MSDVEFAVNGSADDIADLINRLSTDQATRDSFVKDPNGTLGQAGIKVAGKIDGPSALAAIDQAVAAERGAGNDPAVAVAAVAVGVRVGTRPAVSVGVRVATGTPASARP